MKRPSDDDDDRRASSPDSRLEAFFSGFLQRYPRFFLYIGIGLAVLVIAAIAVARLATRNH